MRNERDPDSSAVDADISAGLDDRLCAQKASDDALLARVKVRVMEALNEQQQAFAYRTVRPSAHEGWEKMAPGIERKILWDSGGARSCMVRLSPGATYPAHIHGMDEECVVLEGSLCIGPDIELHAGDFHIGRSGHAHGETITRTGALIYLRGAAAEL